VVLPLCLERGIAVVIGGVFNSGVLAGGTTFDYHRAPPHVLDRVAELCTACERHGVPLAAAALQFPLRHPAVTTVLLGARTPAEVDGCFDLLELELPDALWEELG
jgi:D-threo-aldose 1-dehydrogenase